MTSLSVTPFPVPPFSCIGVLQTSHMVILFLIKKWIHERRAGRKRGLVQSGTAAMSSIVMVLSSPEDSISYHPPRPVSHTSALSSTMFPKLCVGGDKNLI